MMIEKIGEPAMLEQLAEEAAELGQAALTRGHREAIDVAVEALKELLEEQDGKQSGGAEHIELP